MFSFECIICKVVFPTSEAYNGHRRSAHPSLWQQRTCSSVETTWQEDDEHDKRRSLTHFCPFCKMGFPSSDDLHGHYSSGYHHPSIIATLSQENIDEDEDEDEENVEEEENESWLTDANAITGFRYYANAALEHYNNQNVDKMYVLVEHGPNVAIGPLLHINFKAKEEDCSGAPVETFFAQLTYAPFTKVDCCVNLGPSHKLPNWRKENAELGGCRFCRLIVNHPRERVANLILDPFSNRPSVCNK